jgi:hypothetical protein
LSEITPSKLKLFQVDAWVQVACPRLSVDWGHFLCDKPVLTPYELFVSLEETDWKEVYPMDYYSHSGGPWSNYHDTNKERKCPGTFRVGLNHMRKLIGAVALSTEPSILAQQEATGDSLSPQCMQSLRIIRASYTHMLLFIPLS